MRWRITMRQTEPRVELRGYFDGSETELRQLASAVKPLGIFVIASPADDDYDPFAEQDFTNAPEHYSAEEAFAWAAGWNAVWKRPES